MTTSVVVLQNKQNSWLSSSLTYFLSGPGDRGRNENDLKCTRGRRQRNSDLFPLKGLLSFFPSFFLSFFSPPSFLPSFVMQIQGERQRGGRGTHTKKQTDRHTSTTTERGRGRASVYHQQHPFSFSSSDPSPPISGGGGGGGGGGGEKLEKKKKEEAGIEKEEDSRVRERETAEKSRLCFPSAHGVFVFCFLFPLLG